MFFRPKNQFFPSKNLKKISGGLRPPAKKTKQKNWKVGHEGPPSPLKGGSRGSRFKAEKKIPLRGLKKAQKTLKNHFSSLNAPF